MELSPEEVAADDALVAALDEQHRVYHDDAEGVITKYVVVAQRQWIDQDGDFASQVYVTMSEGASLSDTLGLVGFASLQVRKMIVEEG